jgi:hypothetical protein
VSVPVGCSSPAPDEGKMVGRQKTWQRLLALSLPLGNKAEKVERRKGYGKENWSPGNEAGVQPGTGGGGWAQLSCEAHAGGEGEGGRGRSVTTTDCCGGSVAFVRRPERSGL